MPSRYCFDDCLDRGVMRRGIVDAYDGRYGNTVQSDALSYYSLPELSANFSGLVDLQKESPHAGALYVWKTQDVEFVTRTIDGDLALEGMTSRFVALDLTAYVSALASDPLAERFTSGGLEISSDDGSALTLEVVEGGTRIVVRDLDGEVELDTPWTSWQALFDVTDLAICESR